MNASIIRGARLLDIAGHSAPHRDVVVRDGLIVAIGEPDMAAPEEASTVDASDRMLMPGLVNAHSHGHGALARGLGDLWTLELLLNAGPWINSGRLLEDKYLSAKLNAAELVRKGCTAVYDLHAEFPVPTIEGMHAIADAYADVGMRAVVAPMVADRSLFEAIPGLIDVLPPEYRARVEAVRLAPAEAIIAACDHIFTSWRHDRSFVRPALAPTIPLHCSQPFLEACKDLSKSHGVGVHTHLAESRVQAVAGTQVYGQTLTAYLDSIGMLGPDMTAAHCVWLDDDDIARLADRGCSIAHNPGSNMRLGSGIAPARKMLERGVNVGLGTDGSQCSDNQSMFEAMRLASFVSRVSNADPEQWISTEVSARMATAGSARALGFGDSIGVLAPGRAADIVFLDLSDVGFVPFNDPTNQLVHAVDAGAVADVMIGGKWVLMDRQFVTFDYAKLRDNVQTSVERLKSSAANLKGVTDRLAVYVAGFCKGSHRQPYHVNRLCDCVSATGFFAAGV